MRLALVILLVSIAKVHASPSNLNNSTTPEPPKVEQVVKTEERPVEAEKPKQEEPPKVETPVAVTPPQVAQPKPQPQPKVTGNKESWMTAAGIPASEWKYVDYIVSKESSWNPNAVNKSSGACSLVQALPCSKLGPNWRDPVHALKWQKNYVTVRYGGYAQAYQFWRINSWY